MLTTPMFTAPMLKALIAPLAALTLSTAAFAAPAELRFGDLDLASDVGKAELSVRIDRVARSVCSTSKAETGTILHGRADARCLAQARAALAQQVAQRSARTGLGG